LQPLQREDPCPQGFAPDDGALSALRIHDHIPGPGRRQAAGPAGECQGGGARCGGEGKGRGACRACSCRTCFRGSGKACGSAAPASSVRSPGGRSANGAFHVTGTRGNTRGGKEGRRGRSGTHRRPASSQSGAGDSRPASPGEGSSGTGDSTPACGGESSRDASAACGGESPRRARDASAACGGESPRRARDASAACGDESSDRTGDST